MREIPGIVKEIVEGEMKGEKTISVRLDTDKWLDALARVYVELPQVGDSLYYSDIGGKTQICRRT